MPQVVRIPESKLFVSEPSPYMFGNRANPADWKAAGWSNGNWLKSRFHYNFAEYRNMRNPPFGVLRVCNDDLVQPHTGFGTHPHGNMEIVTYIVEGELTHQDSMGSAESLGPGSVQFMSAGSGVYHSEENGGDTPCRFIQSWITPRAYGGKPRYGSHKASGVPAGWTHLVSDSAGATKTPVTVNQDIDIFAGSFKPGESTAIDIADGRQGYVVCLEGSAALGGVALDKYDAAELYGPADVKVAAGKQGAHLLLFKMEREGRGRSDL